MYKHQPFEYALNHSEGSGARGETNIVNDLPRVFLPIVRGTLNSMSLYYCSASQLTKILLSFLHHGIHLELYRVYQKMYPLSGYLTATSELYLPSRMNACAMLKLRSFLLLLETKISNIQRLVNFFLKIVTIYIPDLYYKSDLSCSSEMSPAVNFFAKSNYFFAVE